MIKIFKRNIVFCLLIFVFLMFCLTAHKANSLTANDSLVKMPMTFADLAKKVKPSVVHISTVKVIKGRGQGGMPFNSPFGRDDHFDDFFNRFFGIPQRDFKQNALGTGVIIDTNGYIVTNNHVVEKADEIMVTLWDGREFEATRVGSDRKTDIALIKLKGNVKLVPAILGDSDKIEVGEWVVAIGNPFGLDHTVTAGIISAKGRIIGAGPYDDFIQTDASINPGNSGGPLINTSGEVIGVNTAIVASGQGIGFAIPINLVRDIVAQLKDNGKVTRGWIGVMIQEITPDLMKSFNLKDDKGALVSDVVKGSPAEKILKRGDIIISFNNSPINKMSELPRLVAVIPVGKKVPVEIIRDGKVEKKWIKIEKLEDDTQSQHTLGKDASGVLGIKVKSVTREIMKQYNLSSPDGVVIVGIAPDSLAQDKLKVMDQILEVNGRPIRTIDDYDFIVEKLQKGDLVRFLVKRKGWTLYLTLRI